ncbi:(2Fe-2S)-binding protein [Falsiroseomonas sp.]|uniref:(2Fe-2S)-binding protein n=1 Tax=Falsiroseomonas sp. TaxID=2870721 RepID=UPI003F6E9DD6
MCNALTDKQIAAVVAAGADRPHDVYAACGCRAQCGGCTGTILTMVRAGCGAGGK